MGERIDHRIWHIAADPSTLNATQLCVDDTPDSDLGFPMWCGKDEAGAITKWLAKDRKARVSLLGVITGSITGLAKLSFNDNVLNGSVARFADTATEVTDYIADFGDVSMYAAIKWLHDNGGGGGEPVSLDDAYRVGQGIYADRGAVAITGPLGVLDSILVVNRMEASTTEALIQITSKAGDTIHFLGTIGDTVGNPENKGHKLWTDNGALSFGQTRIDTSTQKSEAFLRAKPHYTNPDNFASHLEMSAKVIDGDPEEMTFYVEAGSGAGTGNEYAFARFNGTGSVEFSLSDNGFVNGMNSTYLDKFDRYLMGTSPTVPVFSSNTLTVNWSTGKQIQYGTLTANCTQVAITNPQGIGTFNLSVFASGAARTITNFTSGTSTQFKWIGNYNLDAGAVTIPSGKELQIKMIYRGTAIGWLCQAVYEI